MTLWSWGSAYRETAMTQCDNLMGSYQYHTWGTWLVHLILQEFKLVSS